MILHEALMHQMRRFQRFALLLIHVEFVNNERGKEKDR